MSTLITLAVVVLIAATVLEWRVRRAALAGEKVLALVRAAEAEPRPSTVVLSTEAAARHAAMMEALNEGDLARHEELMRELLEDMGHA